MRTEQRKMPEGFGFQGALLSVRIIISLWAETLYELPHSP